MPDNTTIAKIFEKIDKLTETTSAIQVDLATVKERQASFMKQNDMEHNQLTAMVADIKTELDEIRDKDSEQDVVLNQRAGQHKVFGSLFQIVLAVISSGAVLGGIGLLIKLLWGLI